MVPTQCAKLTGSVKGFRPQRYKDGHWPVFGKLLCYQKHPLLSFLISLIGIIQKHNDLLPSSLGQMLEAGLQVGVEVFFSGL